MQDPSMRFRNSLCVAPEFAAWQFVGMSENQDKNGGPNNLRAWREARGMSREALAAAVATSPNMILYLETGERGLSLKWLHRLAPALGTSVGHLAEHDPNDIDLEMHDLFAKKRMTPEQRKQIIDIANVVIKTGTNDK